MIDAQMGVHAKQVLGMFVVQVYRSNVVKSLLHDSSWSNILVLNVMVVESVNGVVRRGSISRIGW